MPTLRLTRTNTSRPVNIRLTTQPRPTHPLLIADLASTGAMDDPAFIAYLEYLRYWEQPQYAKFVHYPHAFFFLEQLRRPEFRKAMANPRLAEQAHAHQFWHWQRIRTASRRRRRRRSGRAAADGVGERLMEHRPGAAGAVGRLGASRFTRVALAAVSRLLARASRYP